MRNRVTAVGLVAGLVVMVTVWARPASADPDPWYVSGAAAITDTCNDIPSTLLGAASGTVAAAGVPLSPVNSPNPYPVGSPLYLQTEARLSATADFFAGNTAGMTVDEFMAAQKAADATGVANFWAAAEGPGVVTGSATGAAVDVGEAAVATSATAGGTAGVAATTGVAMTPGTVAGLTLYGLGVGCLTTGLLDYFFGEQSNPGTMSASLTTPVYSSGLVPCSEFSGPPAGAQLGDYCATVSYASSGAARNVQFRQIVPSTAGNSTWGKLRQSDGSLNYGVAAPFGSTSTKVAIPCALLSCGVFGFGANGSYEAVFTLHSSGTPGSGAVEGAAPADLVLQSKGNTNRLVATVNCIRPTDNDTKVYTSTTRSWFDIERGLTGQDADIQMCHAGYAPTHIDVQRQRGLWGTSSGNISLGWGSSDQVLKWDINPSVLGNPTTLACFVKGASCPIYDPAPSNPTGNVNIGGASGLSSPKGTPTLGDLVKDWLVAAPAPASEPASGGGPTTTVPATTVPATTVPGAGSAGTPDPADTGAAECWPSGWGWFNPAEWVLKPTKCALSWLFVPPPTFGDGLDAYVTEFSDDPPMQWVTGGWAMVDASSVEFIRWADDEALPCPEAFGRSFCVADFDAWTLPTWLYVVCMVGLWFLLVYAIVRWL